jgi:hypothetical protein
VSCRVEPESTRFRFGRRVSQVTVPRDHRLWSVASGVLRAGLAWADPATDGRHGSLVKELDLAATEEQGLWADRHPVRTGGQTRRRARAERITGGRPRRWRNRPAPPSNPIDDTLNEAALLAEGEVIKQWLAEHPSPRQQE